MKILIDCSIVSKGGGVQVALSIIENIAVDKNFEVVCVVNTEIDKQLSLSAKNGIKHYYIENIEPIYKKFSQGKRISLIEKKHNPDFIFIVFGPCYWKPQAKSLQGFALGKMLYQKELNIGFFEKLLNISKAFFYKRAKSYLVVETQLIKVKLANYLNYPSDKIFVIGNSYSPLFEKCVRENIAKIAKKSDFFNILVPGSYYPHKNLERTLEALSYYISNNDKSIKLTFTIPSDSNDWEKLYSYAQELKLTDNIETSGFIPNADFAKLYLASDAILCASLVESSTAVFPEAFVSLKPLIVSDRLFARELCGEAAIYFDPLDPVDMANAIKQVKDDSLLRKKLIANGQKTLLKNYPSAEIKWQLQKELIINLAGSK